MPPCGWLGHRWVCRAAIAGPKPNLNLPADITGFSSLNSFKRSLHSKVLVKYFKVYFLIFLDSFITHYY